MLTIMETQGAAGTAAGKVEEIQSKEFQKMLNSNNVRLIDERNPPELVNQGTIGASVNIPLPDVEDALKLPDEDFKSKYNMEKPSTNDCNFVFLCRSGRRSLKAAETAVSLGYRCPKNLAGGFTAWKLFLQ